MKELLKRFCDKMGDWDVTFKDTCAKISITFPSIRDESSGKLVPMLFSFPLEIQERISNIANETARQYIPPLDDFRLALCDTTTKFQILDRIQNKEQSVILEGGRSFRDELRFNLGVPR